MSSRAADTGACCSTVTGFTTIPLCERLTFSTSSACSSGERLRWMTPIPPSRAMAMASLASVTVSIAALTRGMASGIRRLKRVPTSVSAGRASE